MARSCTAKDLCLQKHTSNSRSTRSHSLVHSLIRKPRYCNGVRVSGRQQSTGLSNDTYTYQPGRLYIQLDRPRLLAARCLFSNSCTLLSACVLSLDLSTRKSMRDSSYQRFCLFTTAILSQGIIYRLGRNENLVNSKRIKLACTDY